jgi:hypothetical protein
MTQLQLSLNLLPSRNMAHLPNTATIAFVGSLLLLVTIEFVGSLAIIGTLQLAGCFYCTTADTVQIDPYLIY